MLPYVSFSKQAVNVISTLLPSFLLNMSLLWGMPGREEDTLWWLIAAQFCPVHAVWTYMYTRWQRKRRLTLFIFPGTPWMTEHDSRWCNHYPDVVHQSKWEHVPYISHPPHYFLNSLFFPRIPILIYTCITLGGMNCLWSWCKRKNRFHEMNV